MMLKSSATPLLGYAYGLKQPTLLVEITINSAYSMNTEAIDELMSDLLVEPNIGSGLAISGPEAVLERLMKFHLTLQRGQKIPVFGMGHILSVTPLEASSHTRAMLAIPYSHTGASQIALRWVMQAIDALLVSTQVETTIQELRQFLKATEKQLLTYAASNTNTMHFLRAAFEMGITTWRLWSTADGFGIGSRMRRLQSSVTDETRSMAVYITHSKRLTANMLRRHGIATPKHKWVANVEEALTVAAQLGYPVVVKPDDQEQGRGVSAGLSTPLAVEVAFRQASALSKNILIEKHHDGQDFRLTVFRNQVVKVIQRQAGGVVGDGIHSVQELVDIEQQTPRHRRVMRQRGRNLLELDDEALGLLRERQYDASSIPDVGERVLLRRKSNISAGGVQTLIPLDQIHPDNLDLAIRACEALQLDLCGVDLITPDISQSWLNTGAVIIEMNAKPQIGIDLEPEVYARILTRLGEGQWTIPVQLVICESNATVPSPAELVTLCGAADGIATPAGVWLSNRVIVSQPDNGFDASRILFFQSLVNVAICCMTVDEVRHFGLPIPHFDRIVLLPSTGLNAVHTDQWTVVRRMVDRHANSVENLL